MGLSTPETERIAVPEPAPLIVPAPESEPVPERDPAVTPASPS